MDTHPQQPTPNETSNTKILSKDRRKNQHGLNKSNIAPKSNLFIVRLDQGIEAQPEGARRRVCGSRKLVIAAAALPDSNTHSLHCSLPAGVADVLAVL